MPKVRVMRHASAGSRKRPPEGWELIEPTLEVSNISKYFLFTSRVGTEAMRVLKVLQFFNSVKLSVPKYRSS